MLPLMTYSCVVIVPANYLTIT